MIIVDRVAFVLFGTITRTACDSETLDVMTESILVLYLTYMHILVTSYTTMKLVLKFYLWETKINMGKISLDDIIDTLKYNEFYAILYHGGHWPSQSNRVEGLPCGF